MVNLQDMQRADSALTHTLKKYRLRGDQGIGLCGQVVEPDFLAKAALSSGSDSFPGRRP